MTTEQHQDPSREPRGEGPSRVLVRTAALAVAATLLLAVLGRVVDGWPGGWGALVGGSVVVAVFLTGSLAVNAMARQDAVVALMLALVTYTGQAIVLVVFFVVLSRAGALDDALSRGWVAGGVIGVAVLWSTAQIALSARARIPLYDLSGQAGEK